MIESCTKRRMVISVVGLGILTLLILILEEVLTSGSVNQSPTPYSVNQSVDKAAPHPSEVTPNHLPEILNHKPCWLTEDFEVAEACSSCTAFEINSQSPAVCIETGLKEKIKCKISGGAFRSCSNLQSIEKRNFLLFTFSMLLLFILSFGFLRFRTSQLERQTVKNIERRLAAGH